MKHYTEICRTFVTVRTILIELVTAARIGGLGMKCRTGARHRDECA